jgi:signal transduction histidine kinase
MESIDRWDDGSFWIGSQGKVVQVQMSDLQVTRSVDLFNGKHTTYIPDGVQESYRDGKGRIWYGTWGLGLYRFEPKNGRVMNFRPSKQLGGLLYKVDVCRGIVGGRGDSLWIAGYRDGLLQFDMRTNTFSKPPRIVNPLAVNVWGVMKDNNGNVWISGEQEGLFVVDSNSINVQQFKHDAELPASLSHNHVQATYQDPEGRVWVGCKDLNLWNPESRSFTQFPNRAFPNQIYANPLGADSRGRVWVIFIGGGQSGLGILDPATGMWRNFGTSTGLSNPVYAMSCLEDGRVILVGSGGMNIFHPDSLFAAEPAPPLIITKVSINDVVNLTPARLSSIAPLQLTHDQNVLEFEFAAIEPHIAPWVEYSYKLEGLEESWIHPTGRPFVRYPGLSPGEYVFRLRAVHTWGYWPEREISLAISIAPPWWQRWWFRLLAIASFVGLMAFVYRREVTRLKRDKLIQQEFSRQQIESQEAERKRLAAELHDGLGQDLLVMNNELQQFMQENMGSREELKQVASLVQESIEGVREISANLHPHHLERLGLRAAIEAMVEKVSRSSGLTIRLTGDTIDRLFPKETEIHVYRIIQEALSNIVRHASAKNVTVQVKKNSESIEITVTDDGKGFNINDALVRRSSRPSGEGLHGFGLSSMTERVRIIGGQMNVESSPGSGTTVHVSLPVPDKSG